MLTVNGKEMLIISCMTISIFYMWNVNTERFYRCQFEDRGKSMEVIYSSSDQDYDERT